MKKTFLLIAALLMMGSAAFAGGGFDIALGPKVGYQTATLSYQRDDIKAGFKIISLLACLDVSRLGDSMCSLKHFGSRLRMFSN